MNEGHIRQAYPMIVVGAGPVGLTLALVLAQADIPVVVLEKGREPSPEWRASTIHPATLELLHPYGLIDELLARGLQAAKVQYRDRTTGLYAEFDYGMLADETSFPFRLQCPQSTFVQVVYNHLRNLPSASIRFETELINYTQNGDSVSVNVRTPYGEESLIGSMLLGADGARSTVRRTMGVDFSGYTLEERFLLVGTPQSFHHYIPDIAYVNYISDPDEFLFILRVPEAWRLLYPVAAGVTDEVALDPDRVQNTLQRALHTSDDFPIIEHMIYRVHQRVADWFWEGRVVLLGDAAHVNSPFGGLGLNSGVHDAVDLGIRLRRTIIEKTRMEDELRAYSNSRRAVALKYVRQISERNTNVVSEKDPVRRLTLQRELAAEANDPVRARQWLMRSSLLAALKDQGIGKPLVI